MRMEGDSAIVLEDVCEGGMQNLGGRLVFILIHWVHKAKMCE